MLSDEDLTRARQIRKTLPLFVPSILAALGLTWFFVLRQLGDAIRDLSDRAPVVRIGTADPIALVAFPLLLTVLVFVILRSVPIWPNGSRVMGQAINWMAILAVVVLVLGVPAGSFLQQRYLPDAGYSECSVLKGSPTVFFSDWVKNPVWCVSGKDRAWVREQAAKSESASTPL